MITPLDNPVWEALGSRQKHFNTGNDSIKYFPSNVAPFIALQHWDKADLQRLITQIPGDRSFSVMIAKKVQLPASFEIVFTTPLYQMYCPVLKPFNNPTIAFRKLHNADIAKMLELTEKTKPGPFYERTIDFGNYVGIFNNDELVAMAGERLKVNGYTEVSAICTNPIQLGKGYASFLLSKVSEHIIKEGNIPFLHVRTDNNRAIEVYRKLGFQIRADVYFAIFKKGGC
jgi:predicted GNAT family acetyltransferase